MFVFVVCWLFVVVVLYYLYLFMYSCYVWMLVFDYLIWLGFILVFYCYFDSVGCFIVHYRLFWWLGLFGLLDILIVLLFVWVCLFGYCLFCGCDIYYWLFWVVVSCLLLLLKCWVIVLLDFDSSFVDFGLAVVLCVVCLDLITAWFGVSLIFVLCLSCCLVFVAWLVLVWVWLFVIAGV